MGGSSGGVICPFMSFGFLTCFCKGLATSTRMGEEALKLQGALMWSKDRGWEPWRVFLQKVAPAEVQMCISANDMLQT